VFLLNSRHPHFCVPQPDLRPVGLSYPEVTRVICRVPSTSFSQAPEHIQLVHLCRFRYGLYAGAISWKRLWSKRNPLIAHSPATPSLPAGHVILNVFPSSTSFDLNLGAGLPCVDYPCAGTLGLTARVFLTLFVVTYVSILTSDTSIGSPESDFAGLRNAPLPRILRYIRSFGRWLNPRYIFGAGRLN
jgi:hypothetical protein